jgi:hypothetical protein
MPTPFPSPRHSLRPWLSAGLVAAFCALPWCHNFDYLRDFMDYGLVMSGVGRIDAGEHPYVDFVTPIQAGFLHLSRVAEKLGGGTYRGMTYGGLALILTATLGLFALLRRRSTVTTALVLSGTVIACSATQHTILWYNTLGVVWLAAATWSAASAPVLTRKTWSWHALLALALLFGGLNKISFQLVAIAGAAGFALRAALLRREARARAVGMLALVGFAGIALPVTIELILTGASLADWACNVVGLAGPDRSGYLAALADWHFYLQPRHNYYGTLLVPQIGALIVAIIGAIAAWGWRARGPLDRCLLGAAALACISAGLALLATNHEIAYVALGATLALAVALALAFELRPTPRQQLAGALPVAALGLIAWQSAWAGQRSQFGHDSAPRETYVVLADIRPRYAYLAGLHIPPRLAESFAALADNPPPLRHDGTAPVLFTAGLEWLDRVWKPVRVPGFPLWFADGTSAGERERSLFTREIKYPQHFHQIYAAVPWDYPPAEIGRLLMRRCPTPDYFGSGYVRCYRLPTYFSTPQEPLHRINELGTNYDPAFLSLATSAIEPGTATQRPLIAGTYGGMARFEFRGRAQRIAIRAVLRRREHASSAVQAQSIFRIDLKHDGIWQPAQEAALVLPPEAASVDRTFEVEALNAPVRLSVEPAPGAAQIAAIGWEPPTIQQAESDDRLPPKLFANAQDDDPAPPAGAAAALIATDWRPDQMLTRGAYVADGNFHLEPGGQVWLRANHGLAMLNGHARCLGNEEGNLPVVRIVHVRGDRVQILYQFGVTEIGTDQNFFGPSDGAAGWFGILIDPDYAVSPVAIRITQTRPAN